MWQERRRSKGPSSRGAVAIDLILGPQKILRNYLGAYMVNNKDDKGVGNGRQVCI